MTRRWLRALARGFVGVLLLSQLMTVSYACPSLRFSSATSAVFTQIDGAHDDVSAVAIAWASGAGDLDDSSDRNSTNLCGEHCKFGQQSAQTPTIHVPIALLAMLYELPAAPDAPPLWRQADADLSALVASEPPHAILHCVRRT